MRVPQRPQWVAHCPFSAKTGDVRERRDFLALLSSAGTILSQPGHLQSLLLASAQLNWEQFCTPIWEKFLLPWQDRQSCCWNTARTGPGDCTGSGGDRQTVFQEARSTSGTAPTDRLQSSPNPSSNQGTPCAQPELPMCRCTSSLDRSARLDYYFDFVFLFKENYCQDNF